ncbi:MAG: DNA double-strand break repair nuclease NurA [Methanotrichaceae archaeon]|nr:DNA double-strand break repair nuclease NurA [Methanotrichaceae archaeon]
MDEDSRLSLIAELIRDHISLDGIDRYLAETGVQSCDFVPVEPRDFAGEIFAVDGSNASICGWSTANVNLIRAGYAVYRERDWKRTVITFDDAFLADPQLCQKMFDPYLEHFFGLKGIDFKESDLDRLSSYYRELHEYVAINDALSEAHAGDIILYDGSFDVFEPLRGVLAAIFDRAREKGIALLAVAKSSSIFWGEVVSLPFVQHTSMAGSRLLPGAAWYLSLKDKKVDAGQGRWNGQTYIVRFCGQSEHAFRVDAPSYLADDIGSVLEKLAAYSCSAECMGYPHALFRAHRDIRITEQEGAAACERLMAQLSEIGMTHSEIRLLMQDFHDILEMRPGI